MKEPQGVLMAGDDNATAGPQYRIKMRADRNKSFLYVYYYKALSIAVTASPPRLLCWVDMIMNKAPCGSY